MKYNYLTLGTLLLLGCAPNSTDAPIPAVAKSDHVVQSVLWQQHSGEYQALCYQAFNIAKQKLDEQVVLNKSMAAMMDSAKPLAIITDIDETVLDNSPYNAKLIASNKEYSKEDWIEWGALENAEAVPGAVAFFQYAASQGVEVFYISNRFSEQHDATVNNLKKLELPYADDAHVILKDSTSKKQPRRDKVVEKYQVILLMGDNLGDFAAEFDELNRNDHLDSHQSDFGTKFIVFPNPMYGHWETKGIYGGKYDWTLEQKDSIRKSKLQAY